MTHFVINTLMLEHIVDEILVGIFLLGINDPMDAVEMINHQFGTSILCLLKFGLAHLAILEGKLKCKQLSPCPCVVQSDSIPNSSWVLG